MGGTLGDLRSVAAARYSVDVNSVTFADSELKPLSDALPLTEVYAPPYEGKLVARVKERTGRITNWLFQLSGQPLGAGLRGKGTRASSGGGSGVAARGSFIEADVILSSRGSGLVKQVNYAIALPDK